MATLDRLVAQGVLVEVSTPLRRDEFPERHFYSYPSVVTWMDQEVSGMASGRLQSEMKPREQLAVFLRRWVSGQEIKYDRMFKDLQPMTDEVWEIKTTDLRIFGWIPQRRRFIAVVGGYADDYKPPGRKKLYVEEKAKVLAARAALDLDEPKFATGTFDDLVSV